MAPQQQRDPGTLLESHPNPKDHLGCFLQLYKCIFNKVQQRAETLSELQGLNVRFFDRFAERYQFIREGRVAELPGLWKIAAGWCYPDGLLTASRGLLKHESEFPPLSAGPPPLGWLLNMMATPRKAALAAVIVAHVFSDLPLCDPVSVPLEHFDSVNADIISCFCEVPCHQEDGSGWDLVIRFVCVDHPAIGENLSHIIRRIVRWRAP